MEWKILGDNSLGNKFQITSFGESHGNLVGIILDGIPAGLELNEQFIQEELDKRRPGQSDLTTPREERDEFEIVSGVFNGKTTGAPICMFIRNKDVDSSKYETLKDYLRPAQVDFSAIKKYGGYSDYRGSGRFSGRITAGLVMAGAVAKQILQLKDIRIFAYTKSIGEINDATPYAIDDIEDCMISREKSKVRALNLEISIKMEKVIETVKIEGDSIGGEIKCVAKNIPAGIGGPIFNSLESSISKAIFSIPAIKGIEFGAGFKATRMKGSQHNDPWIVKEGRIKTSKNDSGGIIGGVSIGMPIEFTVAVKPTPTISKAQKTVNMKTMREETIVFSGRHDPCIVPRAVVVVEAMTAIALLDHLLTEGIIPSCL